MGVLIFGVCFRGPQMTVNPRVDLDPTLNPKPYALSPSKSGVPFVQPFFLSVPGPERLKP